MKPKGRPRVRTEPADWLKTKMPKKESEEHRQMRAYFLSLPMKDRTLAAVADQFGKSRDNVWLVSQAFHWIDDANARDAELVDPFIGQYRPQIDEARLKAFHFLCTSLDKELARQSLELTDDEIIEKIKQKDIDGALKDWTMKDWLTFTKSLSVRAKDYKDFINIIDGLRKVVFEWNPNQPPPQAQRGLTIPGNNNKILIHYD